MRYALRVLVGSLVYGAAAAFAAQGDMLLSVGSSHSLSLEQANGRVSRLSVRRVRGLGASDEARRKALVDTILTPQVLMEAEAQRRESASKGVAKERSDGILSEALERSLYHAAVLKESDVAAFYKRHQADYRKPEALLIWRILVNNKQTAEAIIRQVKGGPKGPELWSKLAREKSVDDATKLRYGRLGFVRATGHTDTPQVRVNAQLYKSAKAVKDGELVPKPVPEGSRFAVVWRRSTRPLEIRTLAEESENIRAILRRQKARSQLDALIKSLREQKLKQVDATVIELIDYPAAAGSPFSPPPRLPKPAAASPIPSAGPRGDR